MQACPASSPQNDSKNMIYAWHMDSQQWLFRVISMPGFVEKRSRRNEANTAEELIVPFLELSKPNKLDSKTGARERNSNPL
jgi:hypothetical protein